MTATNPKQPTELEQLKQQIDQMSEAYVQRGQQIAQLTQENSRMETMVFAMRKRIQELEKKPEVPSQPLEPPLED